MTSMLHCKVGESKSGYDKSKQAQYNIYLNKCHKEFLDALETSSEDKSVNLCQFHKRAIIGNGNFGVVFLVHHMTSGEYYAMKTLDKENIFNLKQIEQCYSEKKILHAINFPFIVYLKYFFKDNVYLYYVLPFIIGGDLFTHLRKAGKFTEATSKFYCAQIILAVEYLHACQLLYRDLKPENILIDTAGYIKLTDFGFCKLVSGRTWTLCGTPEYISPEAILNRGYGKPADWWSFGVLLYEMNAGLSPFYTAQPIHMYEKIVAGKYICPKHFSSELKNLVAHLLEVDTGRRYGALKDGVLDLKNHKWFKEILWDKLFAKNLNPPFMPRVTSPGDTRYFDTNIEGYQEKHSSICLYEEEFIDF